MTEKEKPTWLSMKSEDLDKIVVDLAKKGETPEKIGLILRDKHGVPKAKLLNRKISRIIKQAKIQTKERKQEVVEKIENLKKHIISNKKDQSAHRSLSKNLWIINKIDKLAKKN